MTRIGPAARAAIWAALLTAATAGWFRNSRPGWNANSLFGLACAIAEQGTFSIDDYHDSVWMETGDKAFFEGRFYSDKSPIGAFLAVPSIWIAHRFCDLTGGVFHYWSALTLATWTSAGWSAAALAALMALLFAESGVAPRRAAFGGALAVGATPLMGYSIVLYNYLPACALLAGGFLVARPAWRNERGYSPWRLLIGGVLTGLAAWAVNTMALGALALTCLVIAGAPGKQTPAQRGRRLAPWVIGGMLGAAGHFVYTYSIFKTFGSAYQFEYDPVFRENMARGLMGASWPRPFVMYLIAFHPFQGLLLYFPVVAAALAGTGWVAAKQPGAARREALTALGFFVALLTYISGYYMWWGGWSGYAPRHMLPALPLVLLGLAPLLRAARGKRGWALATAAAICLVVNIVAVSVDPQTPPGELSDKILFDPYTVKEWPTPFLKLQQLYWRNGFNDYNWGYSLGLSRHWTIFPLALIWGGALWLLPRWVAAEDRSP